MQSIRNTETTNGHEGTRLGRAGGSANPLGSGVQTRRVESNLIQPNPTKKRMNATERQSQGTGIYAEEAFSFFQTQGGHAGSAWLFPRAWTFPLTAALSRRERGNVTVPLAKSPRARFRPTVRSGSPITPAASPEWQPNQAQSNQIKVNQGESR